MPESVLFYLLVLLVSAFVGGAILKFFKQPPLIGYLLAGVAISTLLPAFSPHETVEFLAELGIVLLLFTLGLEFTKKTIRNVGLIAVVGCLTQVFLTTLIGTTLLMHFGFALPLSFFMAVAFSMSSTAVTVKILAENGTLDSLQGEILVGWLLIQDLIILPIIVFLPVIGQLVDPTKAARGIGLLPLVQNVLLLFILVIIGKVISPHLLHGVALLGSRELLLVLVFTIALAGSALTNFLGLSAALGAFLAGFLIAESEETHAVLTEVRPLRDLFSLLFFASLGLLLPSGFLFAHFSQILLITALIMSVKFIIVLLLSLVFGYHAKTSFIVGMGLVSIGEFAFVLARIGLSQGIISIDVYGMLLSVALTSIFLMPMLFQLTPYLYHFVRNITKQYFAPLFVGFIAQANDDLEPQLSMKDHVVLCGYGRVGKYVGRALEVAGIPFVVVELNAHKARILKEKGIPVVYGDPSDYDILDYAQVDFARAVVIAVPDFHTQQMVIKNSIKLNPWIEIYCRTHFEDHQRLLKKLGATTVIQPEFEASLSITNKLLKSFGQKNADILPNLSKLKLEHG